MPKFFRLLLKYARLKGNLKYEPEESRDRLLTQKVATKRAYYNFTTESSLVVCCDAMLSFVLCL